jgi:hypothetical protein
VIVQLGQLEYAKIAWPAASSGMITAAYWLKQPLPGYDSAIGDPLFGINASQAEWTRCQALGEQVLSTLQSASLTSLPRWRQYEFALSSAILGPKPYPSQILGNGLCEWEIYGHTQYRVYLFAACQDASSPEGTAGEVPAVIHLAADGAIQEVALPKDGADFLPSIETMFPPDLQAKVTPGREAFTFDMKAAMDRIAYRRSHPGTPPKIVEDGTSLP